MKFMFQTTNQDKSSAPADVGADLPPSRNRTRCCRRRISQRAQVLRHQDQLRYRPLVLQPCAASDFTPPRGPTLQQGP